MDETVLAFNLKRFRRNRKMKQSEVGRLIGVGSASIGSYEAGKTTPSESKIVLLSKVFHVTPQILKGTVFVEDKQKAYEAFRLQVEELETTTLELREFLLENVYLMDNALLLHAVQAAYKKTLEEDF